jgi:uncharacterized protein
VSALLWLLAAILVLLGLLGTFMPGLPGAPLVFAGLLIGALIDGFTRVGWPVVALLGGLTVVAVTLEIAAAALGARHFGASRRAAVGAALGALVGLFLGIVGLVVGPFVGAVLGELSSRPDLRHAGRAGVGAWIGLLVGNLAELALSFAMLAIFVTAYLL